jgi:hypothetical protein
VGDRDGKRSVRGGEKRGKAKQEDLGALLFSAVCFYYQGALQLYPWRFVLLDVDCGPGTPCRCGALSMGSKDRMLTKKDEDDFGFFT